MWLIQCLIFIANTIIFVSIKILSKNFASMIFMLLELGGYLINPFSALVLGIIEDPLIIIVILVNRISLLISPSAIVC